MFRETRCIILDFDGVIADTETLHFETFASVLAEEGIVLSRAVNDREYIGIDVYQSFTKAFSDAGRTLDRALRASLVARKCRRFQDRLGEVQLFPGAREYVAEASRRVPLAIGSGGIRIEIRGILRRHGLEGAVRYLVTADDGLRSKPDPEVYLRALALVRAGECPDLKPCECLVVEDSIPGIEAARRAGMRCLALAHSHPPADLAAADLVLASFAEWRWEGGAR